jgi:hypothetical protein
LFREVVIFACFFSMVVVAAGLTAAGCADWAVFVLPVMELCVVGWLVHH